MLDGTFRTQFEQKMRPVGGALHNIGIKADHLTSFGLIMAVATSVAIGLGNFTFGLIFLLCTAIPDVLDGAVAKYSGTNSSRGAFFDSVADRIADALFFGGIIWYFIDTDAGMKILVPVAVMASSSVISYERSKAEALGYNAKGGLMERAERIILLAIGFAWRPLLFPILVIMLVLTIFTVVQRFIKVWKQATNENTAGMTSEVESDLQNLRNREDARPVQNGSISRFSSASDI